jgi:hypothetical protein
MTERVGSAHSAALNSYRRVYNRSSRPRIAYCPPDGALHRPRGCLGFSAHDILTVPFGFLRERGSKFRARREAHAKAEHSIETGLGLKLGVAQPGPVDIPTRWTHCLQPHKATWWMWDDEFTRRIREHSPPRLRTSVQQQLPLPPEGHRIDPNQEIRQRRAGSRIADGPANASAFRRGEQ